MRLSARYFENHCYTTNISSVVQDCTHVTTTDHSNQLNVRNESSNISTTNNSKPKSQSFNSSNQLNVRNESSNISTTNNSDSKSQLTFDGFIEKYGFYIVMGVVGSMVLMAVLYVGKIIFDRINSDRSSDPGHGDIEMSDLQTEEGMGVNNSSITPVSPGQTSSVDLPHTNTDQQIPHNHGGAFGSSDPDGESFYLRIDLGNGEYVWQEGVRDNSTVVGSGEGIPQTENSSGPAMRDVRDPEFLERDDAVTQEPLLLTPPVWVSKKLLVVQRRPLKILRPPPIRFSKDPLLIQLVLQNA